VRKGHIVFDDEGDFAIMSELLQLARPGLVRPGAVGQILIPAKQGASDFGAGDCLRERFPETSQGLCRKREVKSARTAGFGHCLGSVWG
jgi:hypothetical protein